MEAFNECISTIRDTDHLDQIDVECRIGKCVKLNNKSTFVSGVTPVYFHERLRANKPDNVTSNQFMDEEYPGNIRIRRQLYKRQTLAVNHLVPTASNSAMTTTTQIVHVIEKQYHPPVDVLVAGRSFDFRLAWKRERPVAVTDPLYPKSLPVERRLKETWSFPCPSDLLFQYDFSIVQYPGDITRRADYEIEVEIRDMKTAFGLKGGTKELVDRMCAAVIKLIARDASEPNQKWHFVCQVSDVNVLTTTLTPAQEQTHTFVDKQLAALQELKHHLVTLPDETLHNLWVPKMATLVTNLVNEWQSMRQVLQPNPQSVASIASTKRVREAVDKKELLEGITKRAKTADSTTVAVPKVQNPAVTASLAKTIKAGETGVITVEASKPLTEVGLVRKANAVVHDFYFMATTRNYK